MRKWIGFPSQLEFAWAWFRSRWLWSFTFGFLLLALGGRLSEAASPLDLALLLNCIEHEESRGEPFPDGAVNIETLPSGEHTIARGRYQITETTWKMYSRLHVSYASEPGRAKGVALLILMDCQKWYPDAGAKRIAYCYTAGLNAKPYKRKVKKEYAERVAKAYEAMVAQGG